MDAKTRLMWIMVAGALGAGARYGLTLGIQGWLAKRAGSGEVFPLATLIINVGGSFALAFLVTLVTRGAAHPEWRPIFGAGFLGAFTTFSTFELEAHGLLSRGNWKAATLYILGNLLLGFLAILAGHSLAVSLSRGAGR